MDEIFVHSCDGRKLWPLFAPHHYMSAKYSGGSSAAYVALMNGTLVGFTSHMPLFGFKQPQPARREHRTVILPDFQGMGIGVRLSEWLGESCLRDGFRFYSKTSHPRMGEYRNAMPQWRGSSKNGKAQDATSIEHSLRPSTVTSSSGYKVKIGKAYSHEFIGTDTALYEWVLQQRRPK